MSCKSCKDVQLIKNANILCYRCLKYDEVVIVVDIDNEIVKPNMECMQCCKNEQ